MAAAITSPTFRNGDLGSQKQQDLLEDIDKLRSHGISQYIDLPQLIVCGDQSSGKRSVLEAISGLKFPTKDNLCTRFATEVILRHAPDVRTLVRIIAGSDRSKEEKARLDGVERENTDLEDFAALVEDAKSHLGLSDGSSGFSADVLRVEVSGPKQPHLTIVDLPGLIHSENNSQSAADDYANQIVLSMARKVDRSGTRTMGVITKPDTISPGSESESAYIDPARNLDMNFRLGWHVLKNRSYETRHTSSVERDEAEKAFLSQGVWEDLPRQLVDVHTLKDKLSQVLLKHIQAELPKLIEDIDEHIRGCESILNKLGPCRDNLQQQQLFLLHISQEVQAVCKNALDDSYGHKFFGNPRSSEGNTTRLRAIVQKLNNGFAETVRRRGQKRRIVDYFDDSESGSNSHVISRANLINEIKGLLSITRGRELLGMFNPLIVSDLSQEQSEPWERLARHHLKDTWQAIKEFLELLVSHITDERTSEALLGHIVDAVMDQKMTKMNDKLTELLTLYRQGHPISYNHYFTETIQKVKAKCREADTQRRIKELLSPQQDTDMESTGSKDIAIPSFLSTLSSSTEADMDRYACSEILDCMQAYYKVAMKTFVDNVAVFAVECCLLSDLSDVLSPSLILQMEGQLVHNIAAETPLDHDSRDQNQKRLKVLRAGLDICNTHAERTLSGMVSDAPGLSNRNKSYKHHQFRASAADDVRSAGTNEEEEAGTIISIEDEPETIAEAEGLPKTLRISSDLEIVGIQQAPEESYAVGSRAKEPQIEATKSRGAIDVAKTTEPAWNLEVVNDDTFDWGYGLNAKSKKKAKKGRGFGWAE